MNAHTSLTSFGRMAGDLQAPVSRLQDVAARLGIQPSYEINGVPYFSKSDCARIAAQLQAARAPRPMAGHIPGIH